ncbi:MAG: GDP-mannose 4,6-dehydratase, partial [Chitinophagaceae bacterium]
MESLVRHNHLYSCFRGKKVFVTGHTGFKGAWLTALLHGFGASVAGYALEPEYSNGLFSLLKSTTLIDSMIGDIRDTARLTKRLLEFKPDYIFHLAAQPLVRRSYEIPAETFAVNVVGTANLLEAVNQLAGKCTVVVITTDKVYDNKEQDLLYNEEDKL